MSEATKAKRKKARSASSLPELMTHREVAEHFRVTTEGLRRWVAKGQFPVPHSIISQTWYYRADIIAHRIRTGEWPVGVEFRAS